MKPAGVVFSISVDCYDYFALKGNILDSHEALEQVHDMESFFTFVRELIRDRELSVAAEQVKSSSPYGPDAGGWENTSISTYLGGALAWAETTSMGTSQQVPGPLSWKAFAAFLYAGKIFE